MGSPRLYNVINLTLLIEELVRHGEAESQSAWRAREVLFDEFLWLTHREQKLVTRVMAMVSRQTRD